MVGQYGPYMLSTKDNPWDPFTQWMEWWTYDTSHGYHSASLLARVAVTSDDHSSFDQDLAVQEAIEEIVRENISGMHIKVSREDFVSEQD